MEGGTQGMPTFGSEGASLQDTVRRWAVSSESAGDPRERVSRRSATLGNELKHFSSATRISVAEKRAGRV